MHASHATERSLFLSQCDCGTWHDRWSLWVWTCSFGLSSPSVICSIKSWLVINLLITHWCRFSSWIETFRWSLRDNFDKSGPVAIRLLSLRITTLTNTSCQVTASFTHFINSIAQYLWHMARDTAMRTLFPTQDDRCMQPVEKTTEVTPSDLDFHPAYSNQFWKSRVLTRIMPNNASRIKIKLNPLKLATLDSPFHNFADMACCDIHLFQAMHACIDRTVVKCMYRDGWHRAEPNCWYDEERASNLWGEARNSAQDQMNSTVSPLRQSFLLDQTPLIEPPTQRTGMFR